MVPALGPSRRVGLERQHIQTIHEGSPTDVQRAQTSVPDQARNGLPGDVSEPRSFRLGDPIGGVDGDLQFIS